MIRIYCFSKHGGKQNLCADCSSLEEYAHKRLEQCKFGNQKPTCQKCPIHCYRKDMKLKIQEVMRYAGPRMIFRHPIAAIFHLIKEMKTYK